MVRKRSPINDGRERNKHGHLVRMCGVNGCTFKTGGTTHMKKHKASKHGIVAEVKVREEHRGSDE